MKKRNGAVAFCVILVAMFLISMVILMALSALMLNRNLGANWISGGVIAAYVLSCLVGGFLIGRHMGKYKFLWGILVGSCYFGILVLAGRLIYQSGAEQIQLISSYFICMVAGMLGGMLAP